MDPIPDKEFKELIPNLRSEEEIRLFEKNTMEEKEPEKSFVFFTCNGHLIDDYPLFEICLKHSIKFSTVEKTNDRDEAKVWALNRHLAMPSYPSYVKIELALKRDDILQRKEQGKQRRVEASHPKNNTDDAFQKPEKQPATKIETVNVTKEVAKQIKLSSDTVSRGQYLIKHASEAVKHKLRTGEIAIHEGYVKQKKHDKELEQIKNKGTIESELQKNMREMDQDVIAKKKSTKIMNIIFKIIHLLIPEHLKLIQVWIEQALSNSNPTQVSANSLPPAPAPTALTGTEDATETDTETKVN